MPNGSKHWCFTVNNYTEETLRRFALLSTEPAIAYCVIGKEVGEQGTPHLQGFVSFVGRKTRQAAIGLLGQGHFSSAVHVARSIAYCKKDGDFEEFGTSTVETNQAGKRSDIEVFKEDVVQGNIDLQSLRELHSEVFAKYPRFCIDYVNDHQPVQPVVCHPLRTWQQELNAKLNLQAHDREVIFLVDLIGNTGKTWFARYYCSNHVSAQIILPGKKADMAYVLRQDIRVLFVDAPRSKQGEYLQYDFLEEVKNGFVFSSKYESRVKTLASCHVVVSMNEMPDMSKLSQDRYHIIEI